MDQGNSRKLLTGAWVAVTLLVLAVTLSLVFGRETNAGNGIIEPLDDYTKAQLRGTGLEFIAETGRIVTHPSGHREIIWDPPSLPTLEETIRMHADAVEKGDTDLIPYCTAEFLAYLKAQKELSGESVTPGDPYRFPACQGIPSQIGLAPNHRRASTSPD